MAQYIKSAIFSCQEMSSEQSDFILEVFTISWMYMSVFYSSFMESKANILMQK